jgi:AcrR family transcriptional regulator
MTGPAPGGSRKAMLDAARELFAAHGFDQVTIRDIAARAGISPALVMKLGVSKRELFLLTATIAPPPLPEVPLERLGAALVDELVARLQRGEIEHLGRAHMLRMTAPDPTEVRARFLGGYVEPLVRVIEGPQARLRAELVVAALSGLATTLRLFELPTAIASPDGVRAEYGRAVQLLLDGRPG